MYLSDMERVITELIHDNNFDCKFIKDNNLYKPMAYRPLTNSIHYNIGQVLGISGKFGYTLKDTFICIACHELGHYLDIKQNPDLITVITDKDKFKEMKYEMETRAYHNGRKLIPNNRLLEIYDTLNRARISSIKK